MTKPVFPNLQQTVANTILSIIISNSFELVSSHARATSIKSTKRHGVSESMTELVTMVGLGSNENQHSATGIITTQLKIYQKH